MKIFLRFNLEIANLDIDADGEEHEQSQHMTIKILAQTVRQSNIREVAMEQLNKLLIEMDRIDERVQGSNWRIKKYHYISADMDKTRPSRPSSYIPPPSIYSHAKCGLINIKNLDDNRCFIGACYNTRLNTLNMMIEFQF